MSLVTISKYIGNYYSNFLIKAMDTSILSEYHHWYEKILEHFKQIWKIAVSLLFSETCWSTGYFHTDSSDHRITEKQWVDQNHFIIFIKEDHSFFLKKHTKNAYKKVTERWSAVFFWGKPPNLQFSKTQDSTHFPSSHPNMHEFQGKTLLRRLVIHTSSQPQDISLPVANGALADAAAIESLGISERRSPLGRRAFCGAILTSS